MKILLSIIFIVLLSFSFAAADCGPLGTGYPDGGWPGSGGGTEGSITKELFFALLSPAPAYADFATEYDINSAMTGLEKIKGSFSCRMQEFVNQMKQTAIFGLVGTLNIGTISGDSAMAVDCGMYGNYSFDFASNFPDMAFFIVRGVLLSIVMFYSITFIVRGS